MPILNTSIRFTYSLFQRFILHTDSTSYYHDKRLQKVNVTYNLGSVHILLNHVRGRGVKAHLISGYTLEGGGQP